MLIIYCTFPLPHSFKVGEAYAQGYLFKLTECLSYSKLPPRHLRLCTIVHCIIIGRILWFNLFRSISHPIEYMLMHFSLLSIVFNLSSSVFVLLDAESDHLSPSIRIYFYIIIQEYSRQYVKLFRCAMDGICQSFYIIHTSYYTMFCIYMVNKICEIKSYFLLNEYYLEK